MGEWGRDKGRGAEGIKGSLGAPAPTSMFLLTVAHPECNGVRAFSLSLSLSETSYTCFGQKFPIIILVCIPDKLIAETFVALVDSSFWTSLLESSVRDFFVGGPPRLLASRFL